MVEPIDKALKAYQQGFIDGLVLNYKNPFQYAPAKLQYLASWWDKGFIEGKTERELNDKRG